MHDTGSVIILSIRVQCRGTELSCSVVVELFVELVHDLAVLVSSLDLDLPQRLTWEQAGAGVEAGGL